MSSRRQRRPVAERLLQRDPDLVPLIASPDTLIRPGNEANALKLSPGALALLEAFRSPRRVAEVVPARDARTRAAIEDWVERGLLLPVERSRLPSRRAPAELRLWAADAHAIAERFRRTASVSRRKLRGFELVVVDDAFSAGEIRAAARCFEACAYFKLESVKGEKDYTHDVHELHLRAPFVDCITGLVAELFPSKRCDLYRAYVNRLRFGDVAFEHRDSKAPSLTALFFPNPRWKLDWGGETLFYGLRAEPTVAVPPRPGRLVVFDGRLGHKGGVPSRLCQHNRLSLALKYWTKR